MRFMISLRLKWTRYTAQFVGSSRVAQLSPLRLSGRIAAARSPVRSSIKPETPYVSCALLASVDGTAALLGWRGLRFTKQPHANHEAVCDGQHQLGRTLGPAYRGPGRAARREPRPARGLCPDANPQHVSLLGACPRNP